MVKQIHVEDCNLIEKTVHKFVVRQKISHVNLLHLIIRVHRLIGTLLGLEFTVNVEIVIFHGVRTFGKNDRHVMPLFITHVVSPVILPAGNLNSQVAFCTSRMCPDVVFLSWTVRSPFHP
jgi:hypothetical protein